jgi:hypothetical protein
MLQYDADPNPMKLGENGLSADELGGRLARTPGLRLVFLDACYAGEVRGIGIQDATRPLAPSVGGIYLFGSSLANEPAWDKSPKPDRGLFAYFLETHLTRAGPDDVNLEDVYSKTSKDVRNYSNTKLKQQQTPWLRSPDGGDAHASKVVFGKAPK